jgi:hypothetical protein
VIKEGNICVNTHCKFRRQKLIKKEAEKVLKHRNLTIEIQCLWNVKTGVITIITGATGTISKSLKRIREQHIDSA